MPGQVTHFYLASRLAQVYKNSNDSLLKAVHNGFCEIRKANLVLKKELQDAIDNKKSGLSKSAVDKYRSTLIKSDNIALFSAFCAGAVGPDLWTIPNSTKDLAGTITGSHYFDLGHYNLSHIFPFYTLKKLRDLQTNISEMQYKYRKAYILGYLTHISLDIVAHLKVNFFAGAYHCQQKDVWESEQGYLKEKLNIFNNHNKVEHYLDSYVRFFCFEGCYSDKIGYKKCIKTCFEQDDEWNFPNYQSYWAQKLKDAKADISGDDRHILDLSTSLAGVFAHRYKNGEGSEKVHPFIREYFWNAYEKSDNWLRDSSTGNLHYSNFNDKDRPEEWVKLKYFSIVDDIWWNDLNDEADTQYYYLHTVIPDLEKVNKFTKQFYSPEAFGHFINGAISVAESFIKDAVSYLENGKDSCLNRLKYWNLDTGCALRIRRNLVNSVNNNKIPACIDIISILEDKSLGKWKTPAVKEWGSVLSADKQKDWPDLPQFSDSSSSITNKIQIPSGPGTTKITILFPVKLAIRARNTCFYEGDKPEEIGCWIFGSDTVCDEKSFIQGNIKESEPFYKIGKDSIVDDFSSSCATIEKQKIVSRQSALYTSNFSGFNHQRKKDSSPDEIKTEITKRFLNRFVKVSTARKWVFYATGKDVFNPDKLNCYKSLYPVEDMVLAVFALIKTDSGYADSMHDKVYQQSDLDKLRKVKLIGVNVVLLVFEFVEKEGYKLTNAWIDGDETDIEEDESLPEDNSGNVGDNNQDTEPNNETVKAYLCGMHFQKNKAFLLPSALPSIRKLKELYESFQKVKLLIVGHTDTTGTHEYNRILSEERAAALKSYMLDDWKAWYKYYTDQVSKEKRWGDTEDSYMIRSMVDYKNCDSNKNGILWYQRTRKLAVDGICGPQTREALIKEYMNHDFTTLPSNAEVMVHGCGETHPAKNTADNTDSAENRRVEIFFFKDAVTPLPVTPCPVPNGCSEYSQWLQNVKKEICLENKNDESLASEQKNESVEFIKPGRFVDTVFLHCSASDNPDHDSAEVIDGWHKANGWSGIGYHYFIRKNGTVEKGRSLEEIPAAQSGYNKGSIAICAHGLKKENFTQTQYDSIKSLCSAINDSYDKKMRFRGHCEVSTKTCPVFDYKKLLLLDSNGYIKTVT